MREKAQRIEELTEIFIGTELNNLYSCKCLSNPLKILRKQILYVRDGLVVFFLNHLKFFFGDTLAGSYTFTYFHNQFAVLIASALLFLYLIEILEKILYQIYQMELFFFYQLVIQLTAL